MTNILLRRANYFGQHLKFAVSNENKRVISFASIKCARTFVMLESRETARREEENSQRNIIYEKFDKLCQHIEMKKGLRRREIANIINLIDSVDVIDDYESVSLLQWCNNITDCLPIDKVKLGESLWLILNVCNFKICTAHYNALLKLYVTNEIDFSPTKLLMEMESKRIYPDASTYEMCIEYLCRKEKINEALMLLEDMSRLKLRISEIIFNSLMLGYSRTGDIQNVNSILSTMKELNLKLTSKTLIAVLCTYAKLNNIDEIRITIENCSANNLHFTNEDILSVIYVLAKDDRTENMHTLYQYLKRKNTITNGELILILKLISSNQPRIAMDVLFCMISQKNLLNKVVKLILKHAINESMTVNDLIKICTHVKEQNVYDKSLLTLLRYSLMENDDVSLPLLRICKYRTIIKPHYFWPILIRRANKYDFQGILDVLNIMVNEFNILPCIDTITDYVLPVTFGELYDVKSILMKHSISETLFNNSYILFKLKKKKLTEAVLYMRYCRGDYFYKILAHSLRHAAVFKNDVHSFVYASTKLLESDDSFSTLMLGNKSNDLKFVTMDKQLRDFILDFPSHKTWLLRILHELQKQKIRLEYDTVCAIEKIFNEHLEYDVKLLLSNLTNKEDT
ncbi:leucine-rich PPR motif-containing protein, mitochondrial isoform X1 [Ceratina calcarata]|uniref:Leucine-rich PPR motif-containing protein, mitochondrial isoform X1 n=1 Tax=Ceratina calcarata TaxID=156304 RepID=A0AAJ7NBF5_9HYME|nr:leucine-rich PPR motif-containing protein, mitochondrial isoform X1 [Ceratina calcarata]